MSNIEDLEIELQARSNRKTVTDYLNEVDYNELNRYVPSEFAIQYINFIKMAGANLEFNTSPAVHYKMVDGLISKKKMLVNLCHRGLGKTFVMSVNLVLYLAIFQKLPNFGSLNTMIFIGDTMENGAKNLRKGVESLYNSSNFLQQYLPEARFTDNYIEFTNIDGKKFGCKLYGAKTGVRGVNIFNKRPELCIFDDLLSDSDANSPTVISAIKETIFKGVLPALHPTRRKIIFNGTPFNKNDPIYTVVESGEWEVNAYPVCNEFPCSKKDFHGSWEDRFTYEFVQEQYNLAVNSGQIKAFKQEYMLRIASEEDRVILNDDISWFKKKEIIDNKKKYNWYITTDFATSTNRKADYTVIGVWAVDKDQNRYLVDGALGRFLMNDTFNKIFGFVKEYEPMSVGIEVTGQQGGFIPLLKDEMLKRNIWFAIAKGRGSNKEGIAVRTNKMDRFRLTEPWFKRKKIYLPEETKSSMLIQELLEELSMVTIDGIKSVHDDAIDMVSQLDQMVIVYPSEYQSNLGNRPSQDMDDVDPYFNETNTDGYSNLNDYLV